MISIASSLLLRRPARLKPYNFSQIQARAQPEPDPKSPSPIDNSSRYYAEACNEWRGPSPWLIAWTTQLRRKLAKVTSRWRHCVNLTGAGTEPQTFRAKSDVFNRYANQAVCFERTSMMSKHNIMFANSNICCLVTELD